MFNNRSQSLFTPRVFKVSAIFAIISVFGTFSVAGEQYALLVGVKDYSSSSGLNPLSYTESDIEGIAETLLDRGYSEDNLIVMTKTRGIKNSRFLPLSRSIKKELDLLLGVCKQGDSVLIAFAGHGVQFKDSEDSYFCPLDTTLKDKSSLISLTEIYAQLKPCKASFKLLLADACRNDPFQKSFARSVDLKSATEPQKLAIPSSTAAFFSCSTGEEAFENPDLKHGVFFHYVIEGLNGAADVTKDRKVDLTELELYVSRNVSSFVRKKFESLQRPQLLKNSVGSLPIVDLDAVRSAPREIPKEIPKTTPNKASDPKVLLFARSLIKQHIEVIHSGKLDDLKMLFTPRLQGYLTAEAMKDAKAELNKVELNFLVDRAEMVDANNLKIHMKNGRSLTTFVHKNGKWLADTVWFR